MLCAVTGVVCQVGQTLAVFGQIVEIAKPYATARHNNSGRKDFLKRANAAMQRFQNWRIDRGNDASCQKIIGCFAGVLADDGLGNDEQRQTNDQH